MADGLRRRVPSWLRWLLAVGVSALSLYLALRGVIWAEVRGAFLAAEWRWFAPLLASVACSVALKAGRWRRMYAAGLRSLAWGLLRGSCWPVRPSMRSILPGWVMCCGWMRSGGARRPVGGPSHSEPWQRRRLRYPGLCAVVDGLVALRVSAGLAAFLGLGRDRFGVRAGGWDVPVRVGRAACIGHPPCAVDSRCRRARVNG